MYEYVPLAPRHVHLFMIFPGQLQDATIGKLTVALLTEKPEFEAFIYLWGPPILMEKRTPQGQMILRTICKT